MVLQNKDKVLGIIFLSQTGVGILGNSNILGFYSFILLTSQRPRSMDPILAQLTLTNTILLLSHGGPLITVYFWNTYFLKNAGCKMIFYLQRVSRGLSICITCLLSFFQAVTISPSSSRLAKLKGRVLKFIWPSFLLFWIINMIVEINVPIYVVGSWSSNSSNVGRVDLIYCYWENVNADVAILPSLRDILSVGCMVWTSGYTGLLLHRHHQKVKHIHSTSISPRISPEIKATQTILLLVCIFVFAYCASCGFALYQVYVPNCDAWVVIVSKLTVLCFPTISPFVLIRRDTHISKYCYVPWKRPILRKTITICKLIHPL